jgi:hypothetical protein
MNEPCHPSCFSEHCGLLTTFRFCSPVLCCLPEKEEEEEEEAEKEANTTTASAAASASAANKRRHLSHPPPEPEQFKRKPEAKRFRWC